MSRYDYQVSQASGRILNIGCGDFPFPGDAVNFDLDKYDYPGFVQGDAHHLPFGDKSFDTAILGDILEHVLRPVDVVKEAARVSKRLVMTIPEETRLPSVGQHIAAGLRMRADEFRPQHSFSVDLPDEEVIRIHNSLTPHLLEVVPESVQPHAGHINRFDDASVQNLIVVTGMRLLELRKQPEHTWSNWLITMVD